MAHRRRDGTAVQLPDETFERISDDGQRILFDDPSSPLIWDNGALVAAPLGAVMSKDLRFALFPGFFVPRLRRWELATDVRTRMDHPIPSTTRWGA